MKVKQEIKKGDIVIVTQRYRLYKHFSKSWRCYIKKRRTAPGEKLIKIGKVERVNIKTYTVTMQGDYLGAGVSDYLIPKKDVRLSLEQTINYI